MIALWVGGVGKAALGANHWARIFVDLPGLLSSHLWVVNHLSYAP